MRNSLTDLVPYDEATLFDLVLYDCDKATLCNELPDAALEVAAGKHWEIGNPFYDCVLLRIRHLPGC